MNKHLLDLLEETRDYLNEQSLEAQRTGDFAKTSKVDRLIGRLDYYIKDEYRAMEEDYESLMEA